MSTEIEFMLKSDDSEIEWTGVVDEQDCQMQPQTRSLDYYMGYLQTLGGFQDHTRDSIIAREKMSSYSEPLSFDRLLATMEIMAIEKPHSNDESVMDNLISDLSSIILDSLVPRSPNPCYLEKDSVLCICKVRELLQRVESLLEAKLYSSQDINLQNENLVDITIITKKLVLFGISPPNQKVPTT